MVFFGGIFGVDHRGVNLIGYGGIVAKTVDFC